jgi:hypothetical protein
MSIAIASVDATGTFSVTFIVDTQSLGTITVTATGLVSGMSSSDIFVVIPPPPGIKQIISNSALNTGTVAVTIYGSNFIATPTVTLVSADTSVADITATDVVVHDSTRLTCTFNLTNAPVGVRSIVVTNPDGQVGTLTSCFYIITPTLNPDTWLSSVVGTAESMGMWDVVVGDADNDGDVEVYAASKDGCVYQFTWNGASWTKEKIGSGKRDMKALAIGDGDHDGLLEIYAANYDGHMYQFKWDAIQLMWIKTDMGKGNGPMKDVAVCDGDNDCQCEVYGASMDRRIYQFKWNGTTWVKSSIHTQGSVHCIAVGDGDNDGSIELYAGISHAVYQLTWNGTDWDKVRVGAGKGIIQGITIDDGDNDSKQEVYAACIDRHVYEFAWKNNKWVCTDMGAGKGSMNNVVVGDGDNDGSREVYAANDAHYVYVFEYDGTKWIMTDIGAGSQLMHGVCIGDGNNDGSMDVYGACGDKCVYQFSVTSGPYAPPKLFIVPVSAQAPASEFEIKINIGEKNSPVCDLFGLSFRLNYEKPGMIRALDVSIGDVLGDDVVTYLPVIDIVNGSVDIGITRKSGAGGITGYGTVASIKFRLDKAVPIGEIIRLTLTDVDAVDATGKSIDIGSEDGEIKVGTEVVVWPGDTNNDGVVNEDDIISIAKYWQLSGLPRPDASLEWKAQPALGWETHDAVYADTNGDGKINVKEILALGVNWGKTHKAVGAPVIVSTRIEHAPYLDVYKQMYELLEDRTDTEVNQKLKATLQRYIQLAVSQQVPAQSTLMQNYPNPFNPECWIPYALSERCYVVIRIYSITGQLIRTLDLGMQDAGTYMSQDRAAYWDGLNDDGEEVASGVYFYRLHAGDKVSTRQMVVLK